MAALQFAVHLHGVVPGDVGVDMGAHVAFQAGGIGIGLQIHIVNVTAGEGDVLAALVFALLGQFGPLVHGDRIGVVDGVGSINPGVFKGAFALPLGFVVNVHIRIGGKDLAVFRGHPGVFADVHRSIGSDGLDGVDILRNLEKAAHGHGIVPVL